MRARRSLLIALTFASLSCLLLGNWQMRRREERRSWVAEMEARLAQEPASLSQALDALDAHAFRRVRGRGRFVPGQAILLRSRGDAPGPRLVAPVELPGRERLLLVDRGRVPADRAQQFLEDRGGAPIDPAAVDLSGVLVRIPEVGSDQLPRERILLWNRLHPRALEHQIGRPVERALLVQGDDGSGRWPRGELPRPRSPVDHLHYALTWYGTAAVAAALAAALALRPRAAQ
jgi:cytochrome oxidase assembly protein ShyY1